MAPEYATIHFQQVLLLIVNINANHLRGIKSVTRIAKAATTTETHIIDVIGIPHEEHFPVIIKIPTEKPTRISILCTHAHVSISYQAMVHARLGTKVEHGLFFTIIDTRYP